MADDKKPTDDAEHHGADVMNSTVPKHEKQPSARTEDGGVDKDKLKAQIERQKEMAREDDKDLAREREKLD